MEVKKRNRQDDLRLLVGLGTDYNGEPFSLVYSVKDYGTATFTCSYDGNVYTNCAMADDTHVLCNLNDHGLGYGLLSVEAKVYNNDDLMDDNNLLSCYRGLAVITVDGKPCHLELTDGKSDEIGLTELTIEMLTAGLLKGDPFTYDDFTQEQIEDLQRPAVEVAEEVAAAEVRRVNAETLRDEHEAVRLSNEAARYQAEAARVTAENARVTAENTRKANEIARQTNEATRQANELARQAYEYKVFGDYAGVTRVLGYNETTAFIADGSGGVYTVQQATGPGMTKPVLLKKGDTFYMEHDKAILFTLTMDNTELHQGDIVNLAADNIGGSVTYTATENCWVTASCGLAEDEEYFIIDGENRDSYVTKKSLYAMEINNVAYDSTRKKIQMLHDTSIIAELDATAFIKDGMIDSVVISDGYLVITFNTDSGKEPIRIAITDIFNPNNYYTKTQIDQFNVVHHDAIADEQARAMAAENAKADKSNAVIGVQFDEDENCLVINKNGTLTEVSLDDIKAQGINVETEYRSPFSSTYTQDVQSGFERITSDVTQLNEDKENEANKVTEIDDDSTDVQYPSAKGVWTAIKNAIAAIKQWAMSLFARTDGYYSRMIVGGAESVIGDVPQTATYTFRRTGGGAIGEPVARLTEIQGNTGVVNQQLRNLDNTYWGGSNVANLAFSDGEVVFTPNADGLSSYVYAKNFAIQNVSGHKYYVGMKAKRDTAGNVILRFAAGHIYGVFSVTDTYAHYANIITCTGNGYGNTNWIVGNDAGVKCYVKDVQLFDLTAMYGAGNEPATVAGFEARIWRDYGKTLDEYIAYTPGKLINCKAVALENVGQNQWDEENWSQGVFLNNGSVFNRGEYVDSIHTDAYMRVLPQLNYYLCCTKTAMNRWYVCEYDAGKNFLRRLTVDNNIYTPSADAVYFRWSTEYSYGSPTYNHDICINISDAAINGTYKPYKKDVVNLNLTTLTGINSTTGVREVVFPNGAGGDEGWRSALRVVNGATAAVVNTGRVNLKDLSWHLTASIPSYPDRHAFDAAVNGIVQPSSASDRNKGIISSLFTPATPNQGSDIILSYGGNSLNHNHEMATASGKIWIRCDEFTSADAFTTAMNGVYLEFQLATPIVYTDLQYPDGTPFVLPTNFEVQNDGTEKITHTEGEDSIAPVMSAIYGLNAVGFVQDAPKDYTSQATLDALLSALSSVTGHTFTKTWDAANNKWTFS